MTLAAIKVHHWSKDRAETRAMELLERIGMRDKASAYPDQLSGGQQQRVAIARALMTDPELLLLDEITSALDPMLVGEVLNMVAELKAQGTTILMATHEMSFAHEAADRIVLLRHGRVAGSRDHRVLQPFQALRRSRKTSTGFIRRKAPTDNTVGAFQIALTKVNRSRHTDNSVSRLSTKWSTR